MAWRFGNEYPTKTMQRDSFVDMHAAAVRNSAQQLAGIVHFAGNVIDNAHNNNTITLKQRDRFHMLLSFLANCTEVTIVVMESPLPCGCIWPVSCLLVHDALAFHQNILAMLAQDTSGLFHVDRARYPTETPTYIVYHSLASLGMKPLFRGPHLTDPGSNDKMYYRKWRFVNDKFFHAIGPKNLKCDPTAYSKRAGAQITDADVRLLLAKFK